MDDRVLGKILRTGRWRCMSFAGQQGEILKAELAEHGYEIVPTCNGCRSVGGEVRDYNGESWHHLGNGTITICTMPVAR